MASPPRRSPLVFLALLCVLSIPFWVLGGASLGLPVALPVGALMAFCPVVVAVVLIRRDEGWDAVHRLLRSCIDPRGVRPRAWFLPTVLLMPAVTAAAAGLGWLAGRPQSVLDAEFLLVTVPAIAALAFVAGIAEEAGWVGYLQVALQPRWGPLGAAVSIGVICATWHLPGWYLQLDHTVSWTAGMWVSTVAFRVLTVWLWVRSGGSVFAAVLFHVMINLCSLLFPDQYDPVLVAPLVVAGAVLVALRSRTAMRTEAEQQYASPPRIN